MDGVNAGPAAVVPSGSPPHLGNSGSFTVELWFKTEQRHFDHYGTVRAFSLVLACVWHPSALISDAADSTSRQLLAAVRSVPALLRSNLKLLVLIWFRSCVVRTQLSLFDRSDPSRYRYCEATINYNNLSVNCTE